MKWHPKISKDSQETSLHHFNVISEAYEVLSCPIKRAFFDKYGVEKLKQGFFLDGSIYGGYQYSSNPDAIFNSFFNENNPFSKLFPDSIQNIGSLFGSAFGGKRWKRKEEQGWVEEEGEGRRREEGEEGEEGRMRGREEEVEVEVGLEEVYSGCAREVRWERGRVGGDGVMKYRELCSK